MDQTHSGRSNMLTVDAYLELLALNRALMEVRYLGGEVDDAIRGSSYLTDIHVRLIDTIVSYHRERGENHKVESWGNWRSFAGHGLERQSLVDYLVTFWASLGSQERRSEALENQMRPFNYSREEFDELYQELEELSARE